MLLHEFEYFCTVELLQGKPGLGRLYGFEDLPAVFCQHVTGTIIEVRFS
jgi:hypothetical protein